MIIPLPEGFPIPTTYSSCESTDSTGTTGTSSKTIVSIGWIVTSGEVGTFQWNNMYFLWLDTIIVEWTKDILSSENCKSYESCEWTQALSSRTKRGWGGGVGGALEPLALPFKGSQQLQKTYSN